MTSSSAPTTRRRRGRPATSPDGARRSRRAETTLTPAERAQHEAWLRTQGWPDVPETAIVRRVLAAAWAQDRAADRVAA